MTTQKTTNPFPEKHFPRGRFNPVQVACDNFNADMGVVFNQWWRSRRETPILVFTELARIRRDAVTILRAAKEWGIQSERLHQAVAWFGSKPETWMSLVAWESAGRVAENEGTDTAELDFWDGVLFAPDIFREEVAKVRVESLLRYDAVFSSVATATEKLPGHSVADLCDRLITDLRYWVELAIRPFHKVSLEEADRLGPVIERIEADSIQAIQIAREVGVEVSLLPLLAGSIVLDGAADLQAAGAKLVTLGPDVDPENVNWWELGIRTGVEGLERELKCVRTEALVGVPSPAAKGESFARVGTPAKVDPSPTPPVTPAGVRGGDGGVPSWLVVENVVGRVLEKLELMEAEVAGSEKLVVLRVEVGAEVGTWVERLASNRWLEWPLFGEEDRRVLASAAESLAGVGATLERSVLSGSEKNHRGALPGGTGGTWCGEEVELFRRRRETLKRTCDHARMRQATLGDSRPPEAGRGEGKAREPGEAVAGEGEGEARAEGGKGEGDRGAKAAKVETPAVVLARYTVPIPGHELRKLLGVNDNRTVKTKLRESVKCIGHSWCVDVNRAPEQYRAALEKWVEKQCSARVGDPA